jgi:hypothetical protein
MCPPFGRSDALLDGAATVEPIARTVKNAQHFVFSSAKGKPLDRHNVRSKGLVKAARNAR